MGAQIALQTGYTCGGCDSRWSGVSRAHCTGCHRTFGGVNLFDRHRRDVRGEGTCVDPATIVGKESGEREMFETNGIWQSVETPAERGVALRDWRARKAEVDA